MVFRKKFVGGEKKCWGARTRKGDADASLFAIRIRSFVHLKNGGLSSKKSHDTIAF